MSDPRAKIAESVVNLAISAMRAVIAAGRNRRQGRDDARSDANDALAEVDLVLDQLISLNGATRVQARNALLNRVSRWGQTNPDLRSKRAGSARFLVPMYLIAEATPYYSVHSLVNDGRTLRASLVSTSDELFNSKGWVEQKKNAARTNRLTSVYTSTAASAGLVVGFYQALAQTGLRFDLAVLLAFIDDIASVP